MHRKIKVMLIDDESAVRNILKMTIPWEDFNMSVVGEAASGVEAINIMELIEPDLILADIKMPFMDGIEFSRIALQQNSSLKIIILTAYEEFELIRECLRIGVSDYFLKPVNPEDISEKLEKIRMEIESDWKSHEQKIVIHIKTPENLVSQIQAYIYENYQNPEMNVGYIATAFGFNPNYLSKLYKRETNELLVETIINWRMNIAEKLAGKGEKMYLTAIKVGMPDANYFGKCFKKYKGISYSDYQKTIS